jgi:hypothetical protein
MRQVDVTTEVLATFSAYWLQTGYESMRQGDTHQLQLHIWLIHLGTPMNHRYSYLIGYLGGSASFRWPEIWLIAV